MKFSFDRVRKSVVAGTFYPAEIKKLRSMIHEFLDNTQKYKMAMPKALIVPHAGYAYSGSIAAQAFSQLEGFSYKKVILIGPSHYENFSGASVVDADFYETPLGKVKIYNKVRTLLKNKNFVQNKYAHIREHSLEVELPFLQEVLGDFELLPLVVGPDTSFQQLQEITEEIKKYMDDETLLDNCTDFSHYGP